MITQRTIDEVLSKAQIEQVIGKKVTLKKSGANFKGCCPFHDEKSPSFVVSPSKGMYKCFGCGKGGNVVGFVMEDQRLDFPLAIKELAKELGITVEETGEREDPEVKEKRAVMLDMNRDATSKFQKSLLSVTEAHWAKENLKGNRKLNDDSIIDFQIGYAPDQWDFLTKKIIDSGLFGHGEELGLIKRKEGQDVGAYDVFRNRLIFPIKNRRGEVIGFSGRKREDNNKDNPKYINSKESILYHKSSVLYGIFQAERSIRKLDTAVLVEGPVDVIMMHQGKMTNTVGTCGTALTDSHANELKKICNNIILIMDGDKAGEAAALRSIDILFQAGLSVKVVKLDKGEDPDTMVQFVLQADTKKAKDDDSRNIVSEYINDRVVDAVVYKAEALFKDVGSDINAEDEAFNEICETISFIVSESKREAYAKRLSKIYKNFKEVSFLKKINGFVKDREEIEQVIREKESIIPSWINKEKFYTRGFDSKIDGDHTGVYFHTGEKGAKQLTNFIINPLIHIYSKDETQNRRLTEVDNGITKAVLELPSKAFSSVDQFESILMNEGVYFLMDGFTKSHLNKMKSQLLREYPKCFELKTLGWQPEGFWAYYNRIFKDTLTSFNDYGYTELDGVNYLSMAASTIHGEVRAEDDLYKNDRYLKWTQPTINFKEWSSMMVKAYGDNGHLAVMYVFVTLFRDVVYGLNSSCPHLYAYGPVGSGKSVFAESVSNLFFNEMPFFNLNQGTDFAFFNRLERFRNCPVGFNEFDENAIKEEWFRAIKSAFDGEGREKGSMTRKKKTEVQDIQCTIILIGQFLSTKDDASVLSRTIPCKITANARTAEQIDNYNRLKSHEKIGLGGILIELLQHRGLIEKKYSETYAKEFKKLTNTFESEGLRVKSRIQNNFCTMLTMRSLLEGLVIFPFSYDEFFEMVKQDVIKLSQLISESDSLASFWKTIEFMSEQDLIENGWDYKIEVKDEIPLMLPRADRGEDGKDTRVKKFEEPKKLLLLRMTTIHPLYMNATRQQTGKTGLNQETIATYMRDLDSYVGMIKSTGFKSKNGTSKISNAYVFDYDLLGMNIETIHEPIGQQRELIGEIMYQDAVVVVTPGGPKLNWRMQDVREIKSDKQSLKTIVDVSCFWDDFNYAPQLTAGKKIKVKGLYSEVKSGDTVRGNLIVQSVDFNINVQSEVKVDNQLRLIDSK